jgi:hypothetical protein
VDLVSHDVSDEDERGNYNINNFLGMTIWRIKFSDDDIKAKMMLPPWNNFVWSVLHFDVIRSDHDEGLVRISLPLKPITGIELRRFRSVFLILRCRTQERINSVYGNVSCRSAGTCSESFTEGLSVRSSI